LFGKTERCFNAAITVYFTGVKLDMSEWNLGARLRRLRDRRGYSIYDVQERTNYHFSTISKYERNERQPSLEALRELAACYRVTVAELLADEEELVEELPTELHQKASLLVNRPELSELLDIVSELSPRQIGLLIEFLDPLIPHRFGEETDKDDEEGPQKYPPYDKS
jgi:transcriptional regulator with XRE-family HTH domain